MPKSKFLQSLALIVVANAIISQAFNLQRSTVPLIVRKQQLGESTFEIVQQTNDGVINASEHLSRRMIFSGALSLATTIFSCGKALAALDKSNQKAIETIGEGKPFALNTKVSILPEKREVWIKEIQAFQKSTRKDEESNLQFSISEDVSNPNTFYLHQQYVDKEAFLVHLKSPHSMRYEAFLLSEKPFSKGGIPKTDFFSPLEEGADWAIKNKRYNPPRTAYCVTVNLYPQKTRRTEFLEVIKANKLGTDTTEKLALQYTFGESALKPGVFHFHEEYKGKEDGKQGFEAHVNSPHFAGWIKFTETEPFEKPPEVYFSKILEG